MILSLSASESFNKSGGAAEKDSYPIPKLEHLKAPLSNFPC